MVVVNLHRCLAVCFAATSCAVEVVALIVAVCKGRVVAIECAEELAELFFFGVDCANGQAVLDVDSCAIAVAYDAAESTAAGYGVEVEDLTVEQTVDDVNDVVGVTVGIAQHAAIVAAAACIVAIECAGVGAVLDGGLPICVIDLSTAQDASLSAACACVVDVHKAMDVADCRVDVAGVCCHAACILESDVIRSVDVEVLDDTV